MFGPGGVGNANADSALAVGNSASAVSGAGNASLAVAVGNPGPNIFTVVSPFPESALAAGTFDNAWRSATGTS